MRRYLQIAAAVLLVAPLALAGGKNDKPILPAYILTARTIAVVIDPDAGESLTSPRANQIAQKDVETALLNWGRFQTLITSEQADLVIVIRKGSGKIADTTVSDPRQNSRPGSVTQGDDGISIGGRRGMPPGSSPTAEAGGVPHPQAEIGGSDDSFIVYPGTDRNGIPGWRYSAKDALKSHSVPAVDQFRKAIDEAEKAAAAKKP